MIDSRGENRRVRSGGAGELSRDSSRPPMRKRQAAQVRKIARKAPPTETTPQVQKQQKRRHRRVTIPQIISDINTGGFFKRYNLGRYFIYVIMLAACAIIYIANTFEAHTLYLRKSRLGEQIKELRAKSLTIASIKMTSTRESAIFYELQQRGIPLIQPTAPPLVIRVPKQVAETTENNID